MVGFHFKEISNPPRLGQRLKERREQAGFSLTEAAQATNISVKYLEAIELGQFTKLPGEVYAKNFLKTYTKFLGLNGDDFLAAYQSEQKVYNKTRKNSDNDFKKPVARVSRFQLIVTPKIVRGVIIGLLAFACLVYLGVKIKGIMTPPALIVTSPADNLVTDQNFIEIIGQTEPEVILEINGQQVLADQEGNFSETIDLQIGINVIEIRAEKRHGKETKVYRQVMVENKDSQDKSLRE